MRGMWFHVQPARLHDLRPRRLLRVSKGPQHEARDGERPPGHQVFPRGERALHLVLRVSGLPLTLDEELQRGNAYVPSTSMSTTSSPWPSERATRASPRAQQVSARKGPSSAHPLPEAQSRQERFGHVSSPSEGVNVAPASAWHARSAGGSVEPVDRWGEEALRHERGQDRRRDDRTDEHRELVPVDDPRAQPEERGDGAESETS